MNVFLLICLISSIAAFRSPIAFESYSETKLTPLRRSPKSRKALVLTNPYVAHAGNVNPHQGQFSPINQIPHVVHPQKPILNFPETTHQVTGGKAALTPFANINSLFSPIDPSKLSSTQPELSHVTHFSQNGTKFTELAIEGYQNLQAREAAKTLQSPPSMGIYWLDSALQHSNNAIGQIGNTGNTVTSQFMKVYNSILENKDYLTKQNTALNTGSFATNQDMTQKTIQINQFYNKANQAIQEAANRANVGPASNTGINQAVSYFKSTYGSRFRKVL